MWALKCGSFIYSLRKLELNWRFVRVVILFFVGKLLQDVDCRLLLALLDDARHEVLC